MATSVSSDQCDDNIFQQGHFLARLSCNQRQIVDHLCNEMNKVNQKVRFDWHFVGGSACILYLGPYETARSIFVSYLPSYNQWMTDWNRQHYTRLPAEWLQVKYDASIVVPPQSKDIGQVINA
jgi:hypothetical protein